MLTRTLTACLAKVTVALLAVVAVLAVPAPPARASGVTCLMPDSETGQCNLEATWEQNAAGDVVISLSGSGGGGTLQRCTRPRLTVADASEGPAEVRCNGGGRLGWYSHRYDCYFSRETTGNKDPLDDDVMYQEGTQPGDEGAVYLAQCFFEHYTTQGGWFTFSYYFFPPSGPEGYNGTPDPTAELIVEAFNQLTLRGPQIGTAPPNTGYGLVGLPVWLWTEASDQTWGTPSADASAGPITVTAQAEAQQINWYMGDESNPVPCDQGTPWQPGMDPYQPPCGHTYHQPSRNLPDSRYTITGVTTWEVDWSVSGGPNDGIEGTVTLTPQADTTLRINEVQVLVTYE